MDLQYQVIAARKRKVDRVQAHSLQISTMFSGAASARAVYENATHDFRRHCEELLPILPSGPRLLRKPQPGFMDQCGGLERLAGNFIRHLVRSETTQFL